MPKDNDSNSGSIVFTRSKQDSLLDSTSWKHQHTLDEEPYRNYSDYDKRSDLNDDSLNGDND